MKSEIRKKRTRYKLKKVSNRNRLSVFRSNNHIYAQIISDAKGITIASASTIEKDIVHEKVLDQSIFLLDESIFKERRNLVGRVKERILPKRIQQKIQPTDYIKTEPTEKVITDSQIENIASLEAEPEEDISMEYPYINDPQQIVIYWKRNIKTLLVLLVILFIGARSLSMFWVNISIFIDNLI